MPVKSNIDTISILETFLVEGSGLKYKRLAQGIEESIRNGTLKPGAKLPPHRILADKLGITPGTVSRAYGELERMGRVVARVGDGTFVREQSQERPKEMGFRNFVDGADVCNDMSRNMHIPGNEVELLARSLRQLSDESECLRELTLYAPDAGLPRHRQAGATWLSHDEFHAQAQQVVCVNGSQHGLLVVLMAMLRAGDTLVTEHLTYPGLISAARLLGIKVLGLDMDEEGLLPESLEELCRCNRVVALYCTPTLQNPSTAVMSLARRQEIARICRAHNLFVIEDETHAVLMRQRPLPISHLLPERGILIGGMSKAVAAGLRVGYVHAPVSMVGRISASVRNSCWMATPLPLELASRWIQDGTARTLLTQQVAEIERRQSLVIDLLHTLTYRTHPCCPHVWVEVPAPWRAIEIEHDLRKRQHLISTAEAFSVGRGALPQYIRASVSNAPGGDQALREGFAALADVLRNGPDEARTMRT
ncbi:aminotransferase-like domain-containing protein [Castellaniella defragrans]|uniref:DNA-binding transcriptional MocR family regulator n=1 Tax=Castellaniella defragrans TaxID=75697 RepID=A0A7W9TQ01_CASDE|nr:PLP-dependent aminotransferase family protein [Castellaniella defragrans]KAB0612722.1 PLP-dependent aminotransferase family protein [Castellaniella defragrans]MBB6083667.1 DNA-binding transcriptional MocR family regulator [Castellaniella defragrans]